MTTIDAKNVNHPDYKEPLKEQKYRLIREAILASLPDDGKPMSFERLERAVARHLKAGKTDPALFPKPGSVRWYTKAVQLDLEARGLIERVAKRSPIELRKVP